MTYLIVGAIGFLAGGLVMALGIGLAVAARRGDQVLDEGLAHVGADDDYPAVLTGLQIEAATDKVVALRADVRAITSTLELPVVADEH